MTSTIQHLKALKKRDEGAGVAVEIPDDRHPRLLGTVLYVAYIANLAIAVVPTSYNEQYRLERYNTARCNVVIYLRL